MAATPNGVTLWNYRRIPYEFEKDYPHEGDVKKAMETWSKALGVTFVKRVKEANYVKIETTASGSSHSAVGMQTGAQSCVVNQGFLGLHELGHTLGLIHEQRRSDRDTHIDVEWGNISGGNTNGNFVIDNTSDNLTSYDRKSVMHYPAPAKGWQGIPKNKEVWTMRWKADRDVKLGGGAYQGWKKLSDADMDPKGFKAKYDAVPVPMGKETDHGNWNNAYATQLPFSVGGKQYFYGQNEKNKYWFIQELKDNGTMGDETDNGSWSFFYKTQFAFEVGGKVYLYGQNLKEKNWFIQELKPGGKMGDETDHGKWSFAYEVAFPFTVGGKVYFYAQNLKEKNWFIQELKPGGKMGDETDHGKWSFAYGVQFPFSVDGKVYFYGQNLNEKNWFIQELKDAGKMGDETDHGSWNNAYAVQFPYKIGAHQYYYAQNLSSKYWFIQRLEAGGKMGEELQGGHWKHSYAVQFPFAAGSSQYFYGQNLDAKNWFIQNLVDV